MSNLESTTLSSTQQERNGIAREELEGKLRPQVRGFAFAPDAAWMGVRLLGPDRRPVVGALSSPNAFVLAGFGATGLLWAPACAGWLAAHLVDGADLPKVLFARRSGSTNDGL